ncbi:MAG: T9SS type A sorting domain-containing protein [Bacteroidetes bacterium]|nr:T9SS type A sorting domain-containing protein [Bacteroidota bacterium]
MKTVFFFLLLIPFIDSSAQTIEHWWLPERYTGNRHSAVKLQETPAGMVCIAIDDSVYLEWLPTRETIEHGWRDLTVHLVDGDGLLRVRVMPSIGWFLHALLYNSGRDFEYALGGSGSAAALLATSSSSWGSVCTGSDYSKIGPLRLEHFRDTTYRLIAEFSSAKNPVLLRTSSGTSWMAWEAVTSMNHLPEYWDKHYQAEIHVARISSDGRMEISWSVGSGYSPVLAERADGSVFVLYRTAEHSATKEPFGLRLAALTTPGGGDTVVDDGLSLPGWLTPALQVHANTDNSLTILLDRIDSVVVYHCTKDADVQRSAAPAAGNDRSMYLLNDHDGRTILLWRMAEGEDLVWSALEKERLFDSIHSVGGTASIVGWRAFSGVDGHVKCIIHQTGAGQLDLIPNVTSSTPVRRQLFVPDTWWGEVLDWKVDSEGSLWIAHRKERSTDVYQSGLYRVRDLSLSSPTPAAAQHTVAVLPNYPNPFYPATTIPVTVERKGHVRVRIYNTCGESVIVLYDDVLPAGTHHLSLDATGLWTGVYHCIVETGGVTVSRSMLLLR